MINGSFPFKKVLILKIIPINVFLHVILFLQRNTIFVIIFLIYIYWISPTTYTHIHEYIYCNWYKFNKCTFIVMQCGLWFIQIKEYKPDCRKIRINPKRNAEQRDKEDMLTNKREQYTSEWLTDSVSARLRRGMGRGSQRLGRNTSRFMCSD